jgi:hypothetical protein
MITKITTDDINYGVSGPLVAVPKQSINMAPQSAVMGIQIQDLKVVDQQPVRLVTPVNIQKTISGTQVKYNVQFMRDPTDATYSGTSVLIKTPIGTTALQASSGNGPITFSSSVSSAPASLATQTNTVRGNSTSTNFGQGNSRNLNQFA